MYWADLQEKLQDEVLGPLTAYQSQFPDIKVYNRKLIEQLRNKYMYMAASVSLLSLQILRHVQMYITDFDLYILQARINKHGRKLVDYDRLRHNFEVIN